ncbi:hypothetical protein LBMAG56_34170 [Verrucomicrobiota bacterium]|nr:hypothetical protein LBMAG56_34170 [Verrucomicrobiota bacterium]
MEFAPQAGEGERAEAAGGAVEEFPAGGEGGVHEGRALSSPSPLNGERVGVRGEKTHGARLELVLVVVWLAVISVVHREIGSRGWEHPSPSFPLPIEGRGRSEAGALVEDLARVLASRHGDVWGARVAKMADRFMRGQVLPTPSPLNGERVGVRGEKTRDARLGWRLVVVLVSTNSKVHREVGSRGWEHPSPSFPLPFEGRGRSEACAPVEDSARVLASRLGDI